MTDKLRAAAQVVLDAITELEGYSRSAVADKIARDAKQQLRAALAEQDACWCDRQGIGEPGVSCGDCPTRDYNPPRRDWQSLDGKELESCFRAASSREWGADYKWVLYRAIEAALKEKNHDPR